MSMFDERTLKPNISWAVAGEKGMELHGWRDDIHNLDEPEIMVECKQQNWDFTFKNVDGSGRVRVGQGCDYNPLQMIEALWATLHQMNDDSVDAVMNLNDLEITPDMMKSFQQSLSAIDEDDGGGWA